MSRQGTRQELYNVGGRLRGGRGGGYYWKLKVQTADRCSQATAQFSKCPLSSLFEIKQFPRNFP